MTYMYRTRSSITGTPAALLSSSAGGMPSLARRVPPCSLRGGKQGCHSQGRRGSSGHLECIRLSPPPRVSSKRPWNCPCMDMVLCAQNAPVAFPMRTPWDCGCEHARHGSRIYICLLAALASEWSCPALRICGRIDVISTPHDLSRSRSISVCLCASWPCHGCITLRIVSRPLYPPFRATWKLGKSPSSG